MNHVLIVLVAFAAIAYAAAPVCNTTNICIKESQSGCSSISSGGFPFCAEGTYCSGDVCVRQPRLGEQCNSLTNANCWDPNYTPDCSTSGGSSVCRYEDIYGPGDKCKTGDANYVNGGCLNGLTCDPSTKRCTGGLTVGASCTSGSNSDALCPAHSYCDDSGSGATNLCAARKAENAACDSNYQCDELFICTSRGASGGSTTCQKPFAQAAGSACSSFFDCVKDTTCNGGQCVAKPADQKVDCSSNEDICSSQQSCVCDVAHKGNNFTDKLPATCVDDLNYITQDLINAYNSMQKCAKSNNCHDYWDMRNVGYNAGPDQCIGPCLKSAFTTRYHKDGAKFNACSSAAFLLPSIALLVALVAMLF